MSDQQEQPLQFRPYPPVKAMLDKHDPENLNYFMNEALAQMLGVKADLTVYRRKKHGQSSES